MAAGNLIPGGDGGGRDERQRHRPRHPGDNGADRNLRRSRQTVKDSRGSTRESGLRLFWVRHLPLVTVSDLAAGDVTAVIIQVNVGLVPDIVPMDADLQAFDKFVRALHPQHENLVIALVLGEQGGPQANYA